MITKLIFVHVCTCSIDSLTYNLSNACKFEIAKTLEESAVSQNNSVNHAPQSFSNKGNFEQGFCSPRFYTCCSIRDCTRPRKYKNYDEYSYRDSCMQFNLYLESLFRPLFQPLKFLRNEAECKKMHLLLCYIITSAQIKHYTRSKKIKAINAPEIYHRATEQIQKLKLRQSTQLMNQTKRKSVFALLPP